MYCIPWCYVCVFLGRVHALACQTPSVGGSSSMALSLLPIDRNIVIQKKNSTNSLKSVQSPVPPRSDYLRGSDVEAVPPRGDYVAVTWTALPSAFPIYCLLFHMCPEARQSTNTIHGGDKASDGRHGARDSPAFSEAEEATRSTQCVHLTLHDGSTANAARPLQLPAPAA